MSDLVLTDEERSAFCQEITRNRALDYFFVFDNVPLQFVYRDKLIPGELSDLEKRNKVITETVFIEAYHQYLVCNVPYAFTYRGGVAQFALQVYQIGAGIFTPAEKDSSRVYATAEEFQANFESWMTNKGWQIADDMRKRPPVASWHTLLLVPDRTARVASLIPVGNQVLLELISTWTEDDILREAAWVAVLIYDVDGTVLQERNYFEPASNWPSAAKNRERRAKAPKFQPETAGVLDGFFNYQKDLQTGVEMSDLEKRNLSTIEGAWVDAYNTGLDTKVLHPERFRMQLPIQKCSYNLKTSRDVEAIVKEAAPDRVMRLALTYAKGNQAVAEGIISWTDDGVSKESAFMSFLLLDEDGLVIRDRRYLTLDNWPGADKVKARLGL